MSCFVLNTQFTKIEVSQYLRIHYFVIQLTSKWEIIIESKIN